MKDIDIVKTADVDYESYHITVCVGYVDATDGVVPCVRASAYATHHHAQTATIDPIVYDEHTADTDDVVVCTERACMQVKKQLDQRLNDAEEMMHCISEGIESVFPNAQCSENTT